MVEHNVNTVKAQIQSLINKANETTGNTDTNLTDGVNALVSGYGQGGSGGGTSISFGIKTKKASAPPSTKSNFTFNKNSVNISSNTNRIQE